MKVSKTEIPDILILESKVFSDDRGSFFESYNQKMFKDLGIAGNFPQDNHVLSSCGVVRGLHYQIAPHAQAKLVRVIRGSVCDVAVDIRKGSPTFGRHVAVILKAEEKKILYVPTGFAHGYLALEDHTEVLYKVSDFYSPEHERGVLWNDPALKIKWPKVNAEYKISERDLKLPALSTVLPV